VPSCDPAALAEGIRTALPRVDKAHADPRSWARNAEQYALLEPDRRGGPFTRERHGKCQRLAESAGYLGQDPSLSETDSHHGGGTVDNHQQPVIERQATLDQVGQQRAADYMLT
jgi:hypothetical protein